ncbi:putative pentatricopeptide repeat-containing protein At1g74400 [Typha angustifolia]|uniref:putative pentatricopeptide repeat-containing protein At1g74400 n=1 Tax=Typha angustifolia TaxID=59011 RepID=UPI003C2D49A3
MRATAQQKYLLCISTVWQNVLHGQSKWFHSKKQFSQSQHLQKRPSSVDCFAILDLLKTSTNASCRIRGIQAHGFIIRLGFEPNIYLQTSLIRMYSETGYLTDAQHVFDEMTLRTAVTWTSLISAYVKNGMPKRALELFRKMQMEKIEPDPVTVTAALSACSDLGALDVGKWIHSYICRHWKDCINEDLILQNALVNMYAKCGNIQAARHLFNVAKQRDVTTWTSMITGLALHGQPKEALRLFAEMRTDLIGGSHDLKIIPNYVTFIGVLMACSHAGLVNEGWHHWVSMQRDYGIKPKITHFGCMVDMLCRAGLIEDAYAIINRMPMLPNAMIWRNLLSACSLHHNIEIGSLARSKLLELEPHHVGDDVMMSNTCAIAGLWDQKLGIRKRCKRRRAPGCSLIEVENRTSEFAAIDRRNLRTRKLQDVIESIAENSKFLMYSSETSNLHNAEIYS